MSNIDIYMKTTANRVFKSNKGFTLIELLVVIGILAILLSIVLIAINPARQFGQANDTKRKSDVTQILNAVGAYAADNKGVLPPGIPLDDPLTVGVLDGELPIASGTTGVANICASIMPTYIPSLPEDPQGPGGGAPITDCTTYNTGYTIVRDANNRVTVFAPSSEVTTPISISR
jgi:prepilin-type N-terminal cleavage/methylation domain-containing protein